MNEKRMAVRYPVDKLPESLKTFMLDGLGGAPIEVDTFDASSIGVGLMAAVPSTNFAVNDHIILYSVQDAFKLVGEIRYVHSKNDDSCQLGIQFKQSKSLKLYQGLIAGVPPVK